MKNRIGIYFSGIVCLILLTNVLTKASESDPKAEVQSCDSGSGTCVDECDEFLTIDTDTDCKSGKVCCVKRCTKEYGRCRPSSGCVYSLFDKKGVCRRGEKCCYTPPPRMPPTEVMS
ncbi:CLUMA_CG020515, isoform A [Clunio marinus]|uniref:CLUMA_CG020515, isoform A n=1 Tax=Clunio marinus TaxID=568069 RepID=A0A1J1J7U9_9DIPT|nr:CLUMA_CG020515, isoform A [Clunio marinus]